MQNEHMVARGANLALGIWLFISAFLWPHAAAQHTNAMVVGVLAVAFAIGAMRAPEIRYLNTVLAVWLFISAWALPTIAVATLWNSVLTAIAMFLASLLPSRVPTTDPTARQ